MKCKVDICVARCLSILKPPAGAFRTWVELVRRQPTGVPGAEVGSNPLPLAPSSWLLTGEETAGRRSYKSEFMKRSTVSRGCFGERRWSRAAVGFCCSSQSRDKQGRVKVIYTVRCPSFIHFFLMLNPIRAAVGAAVTLSWHRAKGVSYPWTKVQPWNTEIEKHLPSHSPLWAAWCPSGWCSDHQSILGDNYLSVWRLPVLPEWILVFSGFLQPSNTICFLSLHVALW